MRLFAVILFSCIVFASCTQKEFNYYIILNMEHDANINEISLDLKTDKDMRDNVAPEGELDVNMPGVIK